MKVLFLCGGIGKRMFPITEDKFLLTFLGKTLLEHQIETARKAGLDQFVIVGNNGNIDKIKRITAGIPDIDVGYAIQENPLGIANAIECARDLLEDEIIISNPNDIFDTSAYVNLLQAHKEHDSLAYILGYQVNEYFPGGYLVTDHEDILTGIIEKPGKGNEPSDLVNILIHLHTDVTALLEHITRVQTERDDVYECAIDALVHGSKEVRVVPYSGTWEAIKYPWHIFTVVKHFLDDASEYISPSAVISEKATIGGKVIIGDNVKIFENAVVKGPVYIGPNSVVGNNSLVRAYSHIGADCVVGFSTEVKGSYLSDGCWSHMSYIGDSILGERCSLGAGTMLANWRFDEKNISVKIKGEMIDSKLDKFGSIIGSDCKTGVNVSVMPGVKVGPGSIIGSHVCLTEDLEPGKMILPESRGIVTRNIYREKESTAEQRMKKLRCVE